MQREVSIADVYAKLEEIERRLERIESRMFNPGTSEVKTTVIKQETKRNEKVDLSNWKYLLGLE